MVMYNARFNLKTHHKAKDLQCTLEITRKTQMQTLTCTDRCKKSCISLQYNRWTVDENNSIAPTMHESVCNSTTHHGRVAHRLVHCRHEGGIANKQP